MTEPKPLNLHLFDTDEQGKLVFGEVQRAVVRSVADMECVLDGALYIVHLKTSSNKQHSACTTQIAPRLVCECGFVGLNLKICGHMVAALLHARPTLLARANRSVPANIRKGVVPWTEAEAEETLSSMRAMLHKGELTLDAVCDTLVHPQSWIEEWRAAIRVSPQSKRIGSILSLIPEAYQYPDPAAVILTRSVVSAAIERVVAHTPIATFPELFRHVRQRDAEMAAQYLVSPEWAEHVATLRPHDLFDLLRHNNSFVRDRAKTALMTLNALPPNLAPHATAISPDR